MNDEMRKEYEEKKRDLKEQTQKIVKEVKKDAKENGALVTTLKVILSIFLSGGKK